jgi:phage gp29-like protein
VNVALSLVRPPPLPAVVPTGTRAREMPGRRYSEHPEYALTPATLVTIMRQAEMGYPSTQCELFDGVVEGDAHLRELFDHRVEMVAGKPRQIQASNSNASALLAAKVLGDAWRALPLTRIHEHLLRFNRYGYSAAEIDWGLVEIGGRLWVVPVFVALVPAKRFAIDIETDELRLLTEKEPGRGEPLDPGKWIIMTGTGDKLARAGLMRTAVWPALYKRYGGRDWVVFAEKFGIPLPIVTYDEGQNEVTKAVAEEIADNIGNDGAAVVPKGISVEVKDAGRTSDSSGVHPVLIAYCNAENSKLVNGSTLSTDSSGSGGASYALGQVHADVRHERLVYDATRLEEAFAMFVATAFCRFNGLAAEDAPQLKIQIVREIDPTARLKQAVIAKNELGMSVSMEQLRQETGLREPMSAADDAPGMKVDAFPAAAGGQP